MTDRDNSVNGSEVSVVSVAGSQKICYDNEGFDSKNYEKHSPNEDEQTHDDPWEISNLTVDSTPWNEMTTKMRIKLILWDYIMKPIFLLCLLYLFICSLSFLSSAFRLLGGKAAGEVFSNSHLLSNPIAGLMIGVLATVLVQSSSTSTSIAISMVGAELLNVRNAIPIIMGANIGTSVTNTIVSLGQITDKNEFRRAFAGATVHDMFNWLTVIILLPLEVISGYLFHLSKAIIESLHLKQNKGAKTELLKKITKPFTNLIIQLDSKTISRIAVDGNFTYETMIKHECEVKLNETVTITETCKFLFAPLALKWNDSAIGALLLILALVVLCACLALIVKILHSLLRGTIAKVIKKLFNSDFPGKLSFLTGYVAIIIGAGLTFVVQSSSIFTSSLTPLVGMGVISIYRVYPLTLGSNIGTTTTGILAAIAQSPDAIPRALQVAFCHLFFNITGILIFYPFPFMRFPIPLAKFLGDTTAEYRWFAILYLIFCFFLLPAAIFALSIPPWYVMAAILIPVAVLILVVVVINVLQKKFPNVLPSKLKTWEFLPLWMRSLKPLDKVIRKITSVCRVCKPKRTGQKQTIGSKSDTDPVFPPRQDSYKKAHLISMRDLNEKFA